MEVTMSTFLFVILHMYRRLNTKLKKLVEFSPLKTEVTFLYRDS